jgi:tetratricopeptide (TPR) repeat protein
MKRFLWIYLCIIISIQVYPQTDSILKIPENSLSWYNPIHNTDSLKKLLTQLSKREQVNAMCEISYALCNDNPEESFLYASAALGLADSIDYDNGRVMALYLLSSQSIPGEYDLTRSRKLLQKAESLMDEETHWTLKYRVWFDIGVRYHQDDQLDSALFYYRKPLLEFSGEEYWFSHLGSYSWLAQFANLKHQTQQEREYIEKFSDLILNHYEYHQFTDERILLESLGKLSAFYVVHGEYSKAVTHNQRVLDSIYIWNITPATKKMYIAKFLGKTGRAYHHWGWYDSAIRYHDSSLFYFNKVYQEHLADLKNNDYPSLGEWTINYANQLEEKAGVQIKTGDLTGLESILLKSVQMRRENNDLLGVAMSFDKLGEMYVLKGMFAQAVQYYDSALLMKTGFYENFNKKHGELGATSANAMINESISYTYLKMGQLYDAWNKQNLSIGFFIKSLDLSRKTGYYKGEAEALTNLGDVYLSMHKSDSARMCYENARNIYQMMENRPGLAMINENMGNYYLEDGKKTDAMNNYIQAKILYEELAMPADLARVLSKQGAIHIQNTEYSEAIEKYTAALQIAEHLDLKKLLAECHRSLAEIYDRQNNIEKGYFHYKAYITASNAIFTLETNKQIAEIETRLETEKKEQQIQLLQKVNELQSGKHRQVIFIGAAIFAFVTIILILISLYLRHYRLIAVQEKTLLQQKLLRSQMNPHFIFNSLASIQNSIINEEPKKASKYLARFSKLVRHILDSSVEEFIPLEQEISTIENYLELQQIRFPEKFDYTIDVDKQLDTESVQIPPMLAQPFIENAIEHGIKHKKSKGKIDIRFRLQNGMIELEVEDDGVGRQKAQEILRTHDKDHRSLATLITADRIKVMNKKMKSKISLEIIDLKDKLDEAIGTLVYIKIPYTER